MYLPCYWLSLCRGDVCVCAFNYCENPHSLILFSQWTQESPPDSFHSLDSEDGSDVFESHYLPDTGMRLDRPEEPCSSCVNTSETQVRRKSRQHFIIVSLTLTLDSGIHLEILIIENGSWLYNHKYFKEKHLCMLNRGKCRVCPSLHIYF